MSCTEGSGPEKFRRHHADSLQSYTKHLNTHTLFCESGETHTESLHTQDRFPLAISEPAINIMTMVTYSPRSPNHNYTLSPRNYHHEWNEHITTHTENNNRFFKDNHKGVFSPFLSLILFCSLIWFLFSLLRPQLHVFLKQKKTPVNF